MSLKLYSHPLASFCQKVLVALYENDTPFEPECGRLMERPSFARTVAEAQPYINLFPKG